jgi:hypothetical protein
VRRKLFWLSDEQWSRIKPLPTAVRGGERVDDRYVIKRHRACAQKRLPLVRLPARIRSRRSIIALCAGGAASGKTVPGACRAIHCHADDRLRARQGAPLDGRREARRQKGFLAVGLKQSAQRYPAYCYQNATVNGIKTAALVLPQEVHSP